jgi:ParB-like nuclease domain/DNA methylase
MVVRYLGLEELTIADIKISGRYRTDVALDNEDLVTSIKQLGLLTPIIVKKASKKLLAGERRIRAYKTLGKTTISALLVETDSELEDLQIERDENVIRKAFLWDDLARLEYDLFERQHELYQGEGRWTQEKQAAMRKASGEPVSQGEISKRIQLGEALKTLPDLAECETEAEAWKKLKRLEEEHATKVTRSKLSPEFLRAPDWAQDHYHVGDAIEGAKSVEPNSVDFCEVDPPYAVDLVTRKDSRSKESNTGAYTEWTVPEYSQKMMILAASCFSALKQDTFGIFWYGTKNHQLTLDILLAAGFKVNPVSAIWYKGQSGQADQPDVTFSSCYEPFFLVRKGKPKLAEAGRANVFHYQSMAPSTKRHPTQKPLPLMLDILTTICRPGNRLLVPFLGSGVTLIAAYKCEMTGFGWDLDDKNRESFLGAVRKEFMEAPVIE